MRRTLALGTLLALLMAMLVPLTVGADTPEHKILICHLPPGNPSNGQIIEIDRHAWENPDSNGHAEGRHGGDFEITSSEDKDRCEGKDTTTTKHDTTTTKRDDHTTTTKKDDHTTTTEKETTTTKDRDSTTTKPDHTTTTKPTTTTTKPTTTTTETTTTTTQPTTTTTEPPTPTQFCVDVNTAPQAELEELTGINAIIALAIIAGRPYETVQDLADVLPPGVLALILAVNAQTGAFASDECLTTDTTTTTTTTIPGETTTTAPTTTTTVPFAFGAAATVCVAEVPTIRIEFQNTFPELAGLTGTLTMADVNGNVVSTQDLVYEPNTTVDLLYPGTSVNPDGSIDDVPGWILTDDGLWIRDPSDEFLREGISLTYTVNPTATAFVTYPPESSECANPENPPPPDGTDPPLTISTPSPEDGLLPLTGDSFERLGLLAGAAMLLGLLIVVTARKGRID